MPGSGKDTGQVLAQKAEHSPPVEATQRSPENEKSLDGVNTAKACVGVKTPQRKCMGIEPTNRRLYLRLNDFEDRGEHQLAKHFRFR